VSQCHCPVTEVAVPLLITKSSVVHGSCDAHQTRVALQCIKRLTVAEWKRRPRSSGETCKPVDHVRCQVLHPHDQPLQVVSDVAQRERSRSSWVGWCWWSGPTHLHAPVVEINRWGRHARRPETCHKRNCYGVGSAELAEQDSVLFVLWPHAQLPRNTVAVGTRAYHRAFCSQGVRWESIERLEKIRVEKLRVDGSQIANISPVN
jgi:hypothetical protein